MSDAAILQFALDAPRGFVPKAEHYRALARIDALEAEVAELRDQLREDDVDFRARQVATKLGLAMGEARILVVLRDGATVDATKIALQTNRPDQNCVRVTIVHLNKKLAALGFRGPGRAVQATFRVGHRLTDEARQWLANRDCGLYENGDGASPIQGLK